VSAVVHPATNYSMDPDPHKVVPGALAGVYNALSAAAKEQSVKRFVLTSSSAAALIPRPGEVRTVTTETWNEDVIKDAYRDPPYEPERAYPVYAASKALAEKEAWNFVEQGKASFVLNTGKVLPQLAFFPF
jgi:nucleoside-diphosphate-sugar epimerase